MQEDIFQPTPQISRECQSLSFFQEQFGFDGPLFSCQDDYTTAFQSPLLSPLPSPLKSPTFTPYINHLDQQLNLNSNNESNCSYNYTMKDQNLSPKRSNQISVITSQGNGIFHITQQINQVFVIKNEIPSQVKNELEDIEIGDLPDIPEKNLTKGMNSETSQEDSKASLTEKQDENFVSGFDHEIMTPTIEPIKVSSFIKNKKGKSANQRAGVRKNFPPEAKAAMNSWLINHWVYPYPTSREKKMFSNMYGLTSKQITVYFINNRTRLLNRKGFGSKNSPFIIHPFKGCYKI